MIRKYFITGLIILLPLVLTLGVLIFVFNLLTEPLAGLLAAFFDHYNIMEDGFLFINGHHLQEFVSQLVVLLFLFLFTVLLGWVTRYFFFELIGDFWNYLVQKIPVISGIYKTCQELINTLFSSDTTAFKKVVMVPFPSVTSKSLGFVTREDLLGGRTAVFVPTAPNPTSGFLILYKPDELEPVDMPVDTAFKTIISCGMIQASAKNGEI